jgi:hypothetical protein
MLYGTSFKSYLQICSITTKKGEYYHLILVTDNSIAKFSNGFTTDCIFIIFLILTTGFSNGKSIAKGNIKFATDYSLLMEKINI